MSETASLYRRHRPQSFAEVVGQAHVVRTLANAIERDRVHHAYLFVGSRGTGKTSMAKILARSLNCVLGPTLTPCGECEPCRTIASGHSLDVIEMDAASNRSVDDIRDLRERVGYAPAMGRSKIYILDEAHMLTKEAWNAFLKTLEEPPPNTVFVLATTEPHKVMATIVDRCQRFDFQRPSLEQIAVVVRRVADAESVEVDDGAVALISRSASGSFRDALGTLDQLIAFVGQSIATADVIELLGAADAEVLFEITDALAAGDAKAVFEAIDRLAGSGRDPGQFARDLIGHLRQLLVTRATGQVPDSFTVTVAQPERLAEQAERCGDAQLVNAIDALSAAVAAMREGDDPRLSLEVALLKVAQPTLDLSREALLGRIEQLEKRIAKPGVPSEPRAQQGAKADSHPAEADSHPAGDSGRADPGSAAELEATPDSEPAADPTNSDGDPATTPVAAEAATAPGAGIGEVLRLWPAVVEHIRQGGAQMLASLLGDARPLEIEAGGSKLKIGFPAASTFNKRKAEAAENLRIVAEALKAVVGAGLTPAYQLTDDDAGTPAVRDDKPKMGEEEVIDMVKAKFDAKEVEPDAATPEGEAAGH